MGVYGNIHGAFNGLGKPSIKLEFEDNDELLAFQQRMQEPDGRNDDPDGGNFTPSTYTQEQLDNAVKNQTVTGWGIFPEIPDGWQLVKTSAAPKGFNVITKGEPSFEMTTEGWRFKHSLDAALIEKKKGLKVVKGDEGPVEGTTDDEEEKMQLSLGAPGDLYLVRDLRARAKKEPGEVVSNKNLRFYKVEGEEVNNFNKGIYEKDAYFTRKIEGYRNIYFTLKNGQYYTEFTFFEPTKKENWSEPTLAGYWRRIETILDINKVLNWHATPYRTDDNLQLLEDRGRTDGVIHRSAKGNTFYGWITDKYNAELRQNAFNAFYNERLTVDDKYYSKYQKKLLTDFYTNPQSYKIRSIDSYSGGKTSSEINDTDRDEFIGLLRKTSLGAPGDTYIITDTRTRARKDLEDTAALKKYDIRKFSGEELRKMQTDDPLLYEQIKSDLGKVANNALYNNLDILDYRGMQPTYRQLPNYDAFFAPAVNKNSLKGFGLADTKKLIADICRNHYKECAAIAKHLKAETKLQSAFNLWHWLHHNIRYEYDREGREEVRTPARVWADRHRGVDCDCLSVLAWCVLKCMGYNPAFELAAFRNKPAYSHIYINLDGIVVDRVWYVFNSRPPFITKTELFKVGMLDNLGQLF